MAFKSVENVVLLLRYKQKLLHTKNWESVYSIALLLNNRLCSKFKHTPLHHFCLPHFPLCTFFVFSRKHHLYHSGQGGMDAHSMKMLHLVVHLSCPQDWLTPKQNNNSRMRKGGILTKLKPQMDNNNERNRIMNRAYWIILFCAKSVSIYKIE